MYDSIIIHVNHFAPGGFYAVLAFGYKSNDDLGDPAQYDEGDDFPLLADALDHADKWAADILRKGDAGRVVIMKDGNELRTATK